MFVFLLGRQCCSSRALHFVPEENIRWWMQIRPMLHNRAVELRSPLRLYAATAVCSSVGVLHACPLYGRCEMGGLAVYPNEPSPWYEFELLKKGTGEGGSPTLFLHYKVFWCRVFSIPILRG